jgi:outer membrane murein-binding lipoprotein Lpp
MANELDQRFILIENDQALRAKKADGTEAPLVKLNSEDKVEFQAAPVVGGSPLATTSVVGTIIDNQKGAASGIATLGEDGTIPDAQIGTFDAYRALFTPYDVTKWISGFAPTHTKEALDQLAQRLTDITGFNVAFTPFDNTDWTTGFVPSKVDEALNQLAQRLTDIAGYNVAFTPFNLNHWITGFAPSKVDEALNQLAQIIDGLVASDIGYSPANSNHWYSGFAPESVSSGLDQAAQRIDEILASKAAQNGIATLGGDGKLLSTQIPAIAITDTFVVGSEAAQVALTCEVGDVAVRTDLSKSFILVSSPASNIANWQELLTPGDAVTSVNGMTGSVVLTTTNIAEGSNLYFTNQRAVDALSSVTSDLDSRVDALEAVAFYKQKVVADSTVVSSKQVTLSNIPKANSLDVHIGRLALHEGDDYTISGAVVTFIGQVAGASGIKSGDNLYFKYQK